MIPGFERAIIGMTTGETKTAQIPAAEAYGAHEPAMVVEFARDKIPPEIDVKVGQELQVQTTAGKSLPAPWSTPTTPPSPWMRIIHWPEKTWRLTSNWSRSWPSRSGFRRRHRRKLAGEHALPGK